MINRTKIKYALKKVLPKSIFAVILTLWQKIFIKLVEIFDKKRLQKFTTYHPVKLTHQNKSFSLFISPKNGFVDQHIYLYGIYEPFILDLIAKYLNQGDIFIDIGANIGQHSMFAASIVGNDGKVYSFEPIPRIYKQFLDSVHINNFDKIINVFNLALGKKDSTETLHIASENIGGSSLVETHNSDEKIEVKITKGDDTLSQLTQVNLIKIDVEGYEYEVLSGMQNTLARCKPVIILEFSGELYNDKKENHGDEIISLLYNLEYSLYDIENNMQKIMNKENFITSFNSKKKQTNLLCLPKDNKPKYEI